MHTRLDSGVLLAAIFVLSVASVAVAATPSFAEPDQRSVLEHHELFGW